MKRFFDTSVLVAAHWEGHQGHEASLDLIANATKATASCGLHSLAELYATMTAIPGGRIEPEQALLILDEVRQRCTVVSLTEREYRDAIENVASRGFLSGRVYDALLMRCAIKVDAEAIYTWNVKHFRSLYPEVSGRVRTP